MSKHILWMHDLSARADACASAVLRLAGPEGSVVFAHATGRMDPQGTLGKQAHDHAARLRRDLSGHNLTLSPVVRAGKPEVVMRELVAERGIDLVICARTGVSGIDRVLLGSSAARLVRQAPCPILVVGERGLSELTRVVCTVDPREVAPRTIAAAAELALSQNALLEVIAVVEVGFGDEDLSAAAAATETALLSHALRLPSEWMVRSVVGETALHGILIASARASVVVLGTHGRTGLARLLEGSVAESVAEQASMSVLVVP